jgi:S1-C subfamily serine protease
MTPTGASAPVRPSDTRPVTRPQRQPLFDYPIQEPPPAPRRGWRSAGLALLGGFVGAALTTGTLFAMGAFDDPEPAAPPAPGVTIVERTRIEVINTEVMDVATAVGRKVIPSIVTVEVGIGTFESFTPLGSGSGVLYTDEGYVVTNNHVVEDAESLRVIISDGRIYSAELIGTDAPTDLAVIKVDGVGFTPIEIGSAGELSIGDPAIAIGNPLGLEGGPSLTVGVISAFNRDVQTGPDVVNDLLRGMIQTDAPITRGSSGGALVDATGSLIGITTAVGVSDVGAEGIGFATPIEIVNRVVEEIIEIGRVRQSFIGIVGQTTYEEQDDGAIILAGALITDIVSDTGASAAGLAPGDIIVGINGHDVRSMGDVIVAIRRYRVDAEVNFAIMREGEPMTLMVVLGERPPDS